MNKLAHLDVKPANILVTSDQSFMLSDFGTLVSFKNGCEGRNIREGDRKYLARHVVFRPICLSKIFPRLFFFVFRELLDNDYKNIDRADIFSLGASIYEMYLQKSLPENGNSPFPISKHFFFLPYLCEFP